jgi:hypothetical protein
MQRPAQRLFPPGPARIVALVTTLLVAGCQLGQPGTATPADGGVTPNAVAGDAIEVTALDTTPVAAEAAVEETTDTVPPPEAAAGPAPAQTDGPVADAEEADATEGATEPAPQPEAAPVEAAAPKPEQQVLCEKRGGKWSGVGSGLLSICVYETRDNGKQCDRESDCESVCLARSRTCAPVKPLLGCNDILQDNGARVTLCIE